MTTGSSGGGKAQAALVVLAAITLIPELQTLRGLRESSHSFTEDQSFPSRVYQATKLVVASPRKSRASLQYRLERENALEYTSVLLGVIKVITRQPSNTPIVEIPEQG